MRTFLRRQGSQGISTSPAPSCTGTRSGCTWRLKRLAAPALLVVVACGGTLRADHARAEAVPAPARPDGAAPFAEGEFLVLHEALRPGDEAWRSIPWETSLLEARERAVRERKPIYMLVRSGHPLGAV